MYMIKPNKFNIPVNKKIISYYINNSIEHHFLGYNCIEYKRIVLYKYNQLIISGIKLIKRSK